MNDVVADTHIVLWMLYEPSKLSPAALAAVQQATTSGTLYISAITLIEVIYLVEKKSFEYPTAVNDLFALVVNPNEPIRVLPVTIDVARAVLQIPRGEVADMPDRIVAATAVAHRLPVVSSDHKLRTSATLNALVSVIW
jgi:PIN domain nuclease of toxin-antitoxin system